MALGKRDWLLGLETIRAMASAHDLPILAGNLQCGEAQPFPGYRIVEHGGKRIGIVGFTTGAVDGCTVTDAADAAGPVLAEMAASPEGRPDLVVALLPLDKLALQRWERAGHAVDFIVEGSSGRPLQFGEALGPAWVLGSGGRGRTLGIATLEFSEGTATTPSLAPPPEGSEAASPPPRWSPTDPAGRLERELKSAESRLSSARTRLEGTTDERVAARWKAQVERFEPEVERLRSEVEAARASGVGPGNRFSIRLVELGDSIADHPETRVLVDAARTRLTLTAEAEKPMQDARPESGR